MTRQQAKAEIIDQLSYVEQRSQGMMDWKGEMDFQEIADNIIDICARLESPT